MNHGFGTAEQATSVTVPAVAGCGIPFVVGVAPVHMTGTKANEIILANSYAEAVTALGFTDNFKDYPLCQMIYSQFQLYGMSPVVFVNVLDTEKHVKSVENKEYALTKGKVVLPFEAVKDKVKVYIGRELTNTYVLDTDYTAYYENESLIVEVIEGGAMESLTSVYIAYDAVDPSMVRKADVIGGYDTETGQTTGLELIENVFAKYGIIPDLILAPGFSQDSEVAAVMMAKGESINGLFTAKALIDVDTKVCKKYTDVVEWKNSNNLYGKNQQLYFPMVKLGDRVFYQSVHQAGVIAKTDSANDNCPSESQSNKSMQIDSLVLEDGTEVTMTLPQANYLNDNGVCTALNFIGGFKAFGNTAANYPSNRDIKDYMFCVSRTFQWVAKNFVLSFWDKLDKKMTPVLIDSITQTFNIYLSGLTTEQKILGGRIVVLAEENPLTNLMAGKIKFHVYLTPPSPAQQIEAVFEYDLAYLQALVA